jgi:drug/metabolite transporter (DMT)-like permease
MIPLQVIGFSLLVALGWATSNMFVKKASVNIPIQLVYIIYTTFAFIGVAIYAFTQWRFILNNRNSVTKENVYYLLAAAIINPVLATILFFWLLKQYPASHVIPITYTTPLFTLFIAYLLIGEPISSKAFLGTLLIVLGCGLVITQ